MGGSHLLELWLTFAGQVVQNPPDYSFRSAICSSTSWRVWSIFSSYSFCDRNSWMSVSLSRLFSFSSVYFKAMSLPPGICMFPLYQNTLVFANQAITGIRHNAHVPGCGYGFYRKAFLRCSLMEPGLVQPHRAPARARIPGCMLPGQGSF